METQASVKTKCDGCSATLSNSAYSDKRGTLSVNLRDGQDEHGYDKHNRYDYCGEACMLAHLQGRAKSAKASLESRASINTIGGYLMELDVTKAPGYKKPATS